MKLGKKTKTAFASIAALIVLAILVHSVLVWRSSSALRAVRAEIQAAGLPMTADEIIPKEIPDAENAARELDQAFVIMTSKNGKVYAAGKEGGDSNASIQRIADLEAKSEPLTAEEQEEFKTLMAGEDVVAALKHIRAATTKPDGCFDVDYAAGPGTLLPHLMHVRDAVRLLCCSARLRHADGDTAGALDDLEAGFHIERILQKDPILIMQLLRVACRRMLHREIRRLSSSASFTAADWGRIEQAVGKSDLRDAMILAMDGERLFFGEWFWRGIDSGEMDGNDFIALHGAGGTGDRVGYGLYASYLFKPLRQADHAAYLRQMLRTRKAMAGETEWPTDEDFQNDVPKYCVMTRLMAPALGPRLLENGRSDRRVQVTGMALHRYKLKHGAFPESLDKLVPEFLPQIENDFWSGKPLIYQPQDNGFLLYSIGDNKTDDGGKGPHDDIVWRHPAKQP